MGLDSWKFTEFDPMRVAWVTTKDDLAQLIEVVRTADFAVLDLETTGLAEHAWYGGPMNGGYPARIVLASLTLVTPGNYSAPDTWLIPLSHPESPWRGKHQKVTRALVKAIKKFGVKLVNHNIKFDLRWIYAQTGVDLVENLYWDTLTSSHLLDENTSAKLKERVPATFGVEAWNDFPLNKPGDAEKVSMVQLGVYAAQDTFYDWQLAASHMVRMFDKAASDPDDVDPAELPMFPDEVEDARLGQINRWVGVPTVRTLTRMEQRGMGFDRELAITKRDEDLAKVQKLAGELAARYGMDSEDMSWSGNSKLFNEWADRAVDAGDLRVSKVTPTGNVSWDKKVLTRQARAGSEVAQDLLDLRQAQRRAQFIESWLKVVTRDGRIHSTYNAGRVATGRLSSSDPNMQQVTYALKPCFIPSEGHFIADLDYSQVEMRVAAFISRSQPMIDAFKAGIDTHKLMASEITSKSVDEVNKVERQAGKSANFGLLYGMGVASFRDYAEDTYGVSFTLEEAERVHEAYFQLWTGLHEWHNSVSEIVRRDGQVRSPIGRVRRLPGIYDRNESRQMEAIRAGINSPVQGFASDLMQMSAASIEGVLLGGTGRPLRRPITPNPKETLGVAGARLVGTVHDSIVVEVPQNRWREVAEECQSRMVRVVDVVREKFGIDFDVPLVADINCGTRWGLSDISDPAPGPDPQQAP